MTRDVVAHPLSDRKRRAPTDWPATEAWLQGAQGRVAASVAIHR